MAAFFGPTPSVSSWRGSSAAEERRLLLDNVDVLLRQHCHDLAQRIELSHRELLEQIALVSPSPMASRQASKPKTRELPPVSPRGTVQGELAPPSPRGNPVSAHASEDKFACISEKEIVALDIAEAPGVPAAPSPAASIPVKPERSRRDSGASFFTEELTRQTKMRETVKSVTADFDSQKPLNWRERLSRAVNSWWFEGFFCTLILLNLLSFGVETEIMAHRRIEVTPVFFFVVGWVFALVYTVELALHVVAEGSRFFASEFVLGNLLDMTIVIVTVLEMALDSWLLQDGQGRNSNLAHMRVVRIVRTVRVLRVVRVMKLFRSLRILVYSVLNTMKSLFWVIVMLMLIIYLVALLFTQAANTHIVKLGDDGPEVAQLIRYYGSLAQSVYTLFKVITAGLDWESAAAPLESISVSWMLVFVSFVAFNYLALLNVVMGLVCQTAIESAQHDLDVVVQTQLSYQEEYTKKFKALFKNIDLQDTGTLTLADLEQRLQDSSMQEYFAAMDLTTSEAWTLFKLLDTNGSHVINVEEFVNGCLRLRGNARSIDMHMLMYESKWMLKQLANLGRTVKKQENLLEEHITTREEQAGKSLPVFREALPSEHDVRQEVSQEALQEKQKRRLMSV